MKRVFVDANILFSAAYREDAGLLRLWHIREVELTTSDYAAQEAAMNLSEPDQRRRLDELLKRINVERRPAILPCLPAGTVLPEKDKPILQAAMAAGAGFLLTGDVAHFGRYFGKTIGGVRILLPSDFLRETGM